jgi:hypothetical protein
MRGPSDGATRRPVADGQGNNKADVLTDVSACDNQTRGFYGTDEANIVRATTEQRIADHREPARETQLAAQQRARNEFNALRSDSTPVHSS